MTLTEALSPYTVRPPDDVPITSDRVAIEYDVIAGQCTLSRIIVEIGDDLFLRIDKPWGVGRGLSVEIEGGPDRRAHGSFDLTDDCARDLAACLDWAARQEDIPLSE